MTTGQGDHSHLDSDLGWALGVLFRAYVRSTEGALQDLPGGVRGYQVLTAALADPPRNQGAIAEEIGVDRTVLTYLIDDLQRLDLVARHADPTDRRSRLVVATDNGRASWEQHRRALERVEEHLLGSLPTSEVPAVRATLQHLASAAQTADPLDDLCEVALRVQ